MGQYYPHFDSDSGLHTLFLTNLDGPKSPFLIKKAGKVMAIEPKWRRQIDERDIRNLNRLAEELELRLPFSVILCSGIG
jgi:hypothetical protein